MEVYDSFKLLNILIKMYVVNKRKKGAWGVMYVFEMKLFSCLFNVYQK